MSMEALFVDVGAESAEQVKNEFGIHLGDPVVPDVNIIVQSRSGSGV